MKKITLELTDEQINSLINGEEVVVLQSALVKPKSELKMMKEKYESGNYIAIFFHTGFNAWTTTVFNKPSFCELVKWKLIHNKHKDILYAYLKDNSVEIEYDDVGVGWTDSWEDFIESYDERVDYKLKSKEEYPIFKINEVGGIYKICENSVRLMFCNTKDHIGKIYPKNQLKEYSTIPYNKERGLYHKQPCFLFFGKDVSIDFYDAKRDGFIIDKYKFKVYDRIEPITSDQLKVMLFIWDLYKQLED